MKQLFEIKQTTDLINQTRRSNLYAKLEIQVLEWAYDKIKTHGRSMGEYKIRARLTKLQEKQASKEIMAFATKPARAKQINALKWVVDEGEI